MWESYEQTRDRRRSRCDWRAAEVKLHAASFPADWTRLSDILTHARVRPKQMLVGAAHFAGGVNAHENTRGFCGLRGRPCADFVCPSGWDPVSRIAPWCHDRGVIFLRTFLGNNSAARWCAGCEATKCRGWGWGGCGGSSSAVGPSLTPVCLFV